MKRILVLSLLALLALFSFSLCGCPGKNAVDMSSPDYRTGYQAGHDHGYQQGQADKQKGQESNETPSVPQGDYTSDYRAGFSDGYVDGYKEGFEAEAGADKQNPDYIAGFEYGYNSGAREGYEDYMQGKPYSPTDVSYYDYEKTYKDGFMAGYEKGYARGYEHAKAGGDQLDDWYSHFKEEDSEKEWWEDGEEEQADAWSLDELVDRDWRTQELPDSAYYYRVWFNSVDHTFEQSYDWWKYQDKGTYVVDEEAKTLTTTVTHIENEENRPEGTPRKQVWTVEMVDEVSKLFYLVDSYGNRYLCEYWWHHYPENMGP